jgi:hypothetical protein
VNKKGTVYRVDWYDPEGRRHLKEFELKKDADAYRGKIDAVKKENRYHGPLTQASGISWPWLKSISGDKLLSKIT